MPNDAWWIITILWEKIYPKLQLFDQTIFLSKFAKNRRLSVFTHKIMYRTYTEIHPIFLNFVTLIDHNFGTKSPFELKQKTF